VEFEFVVEMNLVQIGTNEFSPQLIRLAANERPSSAIISSALPTRKLRVCLSKIHSCNNVTQPHPMTVFC
jgi:hypothetical protein